MKKLITAIAIIFSAAYVNAQPGAGNPGTTPTPFGFVEILIAAGAAYGGKKVYDKKKASKED